MLSAETLFAAAFGYLLMGDRLNAAGLAGSALIFASIVGCNCCPSAPIGACLITE